MSSISRASVDLARPRGFSPLHAVLGLVLVAIAVAVTWDGWADIVWLAWNDPESSHILLVPVVFGWLILVRRDRLRDARPRLSLVGPMLVALGWAAWEIGYVESYRIGMHLGAVAAVAGVIISVVGSQVFWRLLPAFGALLFLIPVPYSIRVPLSMPLQNYTAAITGNLLQVVGTPVTRSGSLLTINGVDVGVAEACNGMRMVFTLVLVSYVFAFISPLRLSVRVLILAACPLLALVCNVIRLVPTIYIYGYASHDVAELFHDFSGWGMTGISFLILLGLLWLARALGLPVDRPDAAGPDVDAAGGDSGASAVTAAPATPKPAGAPA